MYDTYREGVCAFGLSCDMPLCVASFLHFDCVFLTVQFEVVPERLPTGDGHARAVLVVYAVMTI
jgi:hypothetical protein